MQIRWPLRVELAIYTPGSGAAPHSDLLRLTTGAVRPAVCTVWCKGRVQPSPDAMQHLLVCQACERLQQKRMKQPVLHVV